MDFASETRSNRKHPFADFSCALGVPNNSEKKATNYSLVMNNFSKSPNSPPRKDENNRVEAEYRAARVTFYRSMAKEAFRTGCAQDARAQLLRGGVSRAWKLDIYLDEKSKKGFLLPGVKATERGDFETRGCTACS